MILLIITFCGQKVENPLKSCWYYVGNYWKTFKVV